MKKNRIPTYLYKYTSINDNTIQNLAQSQLYFSSPTKFNDPFDSNGYISFKALTRNDLLSSINITGGEETFIQTIDEAVIKNTCNDNNFPEKLRNAVHVVGEQFISKIGVCCLSASQKNLLMWAHYAKNHQGIVLKYESSKIAKLTSGGKVCYTQEYPSFRNILIRKCTPAGIWNYLLLTKSIDWKYEKEWRFFSKIPDSFQQIPGILKEIIWGHRTSDTDKNCILDLKLKIKYSQATIDKNSYKLNITT